MKSPFDIFLDNQEWVEVENPDRGDGALPYVTHKGMVTIADMPLRCYQLSDGRRVFDGDDMKKALGGALK